MFSCISVIKCLTVNLLGQTYEDPSLTDYETEKKKIMGKVNFEEPTEATKILEIVNKFATEPHDDK